MGALLILSSMSNRCLPALTLSHILKLRSHSAFEVVKVGKLDVAVSLQVPKITTTLTAAYGEHLLVRSPN